MSVPDDCKTIYVDQTVSNDICNGSYTLDEATQKWVNDNDPKCKLTKIFDSATGQYKWAFSVELPEGSDPPPGAVYSVSFPHYKKYSMVVGTYGENLTGLWTPKDSVPLDNFYGYNIQHGDNLSIANDSALPQTINYDDKELSLSDTTVGYIASNLSEYEGEGGSFWFYKDDINGPFVHHYELDESNAVYSKRLSYFTYNQNASSIQDKPNSGFYQFPLWLGYNTMTYSSINNASRVELPSVLPYEHAGNPPHTPTSVHTSNSISIDSFCAIPAIDVISTRNFGEQDTDNSFSNNQDFEGVSVGLTRYAGIGQPIQYIVRNLFEDEITSGSFTNEKFGFYQWAEANSDGRCLSIGWFLKTNVSSTTDESSDCPADGDWQDGVTVSKNPIDSSGGSGSGSGSGSDSDSGSGSGSGSDSDSDSDSGSGSGSGTGTRADYTGKTIASKYKGWVFDERTSAISGPFDAQGITSITTKDNSSEMFCVNQDKEIKKTDLLEFNNPNFPTFTDPYTNITTPFDGEVTKGIVLSETGQGFSYRNRYLSEPFADSIIGSGTVKMPLFFANSYLANTETNWMHLGDEHSEKQVYRVDLRFHKNSCGHLWLYVMNDEGLVKGQYKGAIKEHMKVFTNLRGRSFKIQMMIATHYDHPWAMREMAIGHLYGKSF